MYPALAVLQALKEHKPTWNTDGSVLWVGGEKGMEQEILSRQNIEFKTIPAAGLHGVGLKSLPGNISLLMKGYLKARQILREYCPDVLFFTGGYLAVPVAFAGRSVPSIVFIPDIEPGLAIKTITNLAAQIAVSVDQTRLYIPPAKPVTVSGYPVRAELLKWSREEAFRTFNLNPDLPILLIFGGSKGARSINRAVKGILLELLKETQVIHITGKLDFDEMLTCQDSLSDKELTNYRVFPFLHDDMGAALRIADLVVSRSGASILGEYPMFGLPAILVPYPYAWSYQKTNAQYLADRGAADIINDEDLNEKLLPRIKALINNQVELSRMRSKMEILAQPEAAKTIAQQLLSLAEIASGGKLL